MRLSRWTNSPFGFEHDRSGGENAAASGAYSGRYAISRRPSRWKAGSRSTARTMSSTGTTSCRPKPVRSRLSLPVPRASSAGSRRLIKWRMCGYISLRVESPWTHAPNSSRAPRRSAGRGPGGAQRSAPVPGVGGAAPAHPYRRRRPRRPPDVRLPADADAAVRAGDGGTASLAHDPASRRFGAHRPRVRRRAAAFLHRDDRAEGGTLAERPHGEGQAQRTPYEEMGRRRPPAAGEPGDPHRRHDALRLGRAAGRAGARGRELPARDLRGRGLLRHVAAARLAPDFGEPLSRDPTLSPARHRAHPRLLRCEAAADEGRPPAVRGPAVVVAFPAQHSLGLQAEVRAGHRRRRRVRRRRPLQRMAPRPLRRRDPVAIPQCDRSRKRDHPAPAIRRREPGVRVLRRDRDAARRSAVCSRSTGPPGASCGAIATATGPREAPATAPTTASWWPPATTAPWRASTRPPESAAGNSAPTAWREAARSWRTGASTPRPSRDGCTA